MALFQKVFGKKNQQPDGSVAPPEQQAPAQPSMIPPRQERSKFSKVMDYALPALFGMTSGIGAIPGLASAYAGQMGGKEKRHQFDVEQGVKQSESLRKAEADRIKAEMDQRRLDEQSSYHKGMLGLGRDRLGASKNKMKLDEKYYDLISRYQAGDSTLTQEDVNFIKLYDQRLRSNRFAPEDYPTAGED